MSIQYVDAVCSAISSLAQPFAITATVNDKLQIVIDGGAPINITLNPGTARTAAQIVTDINAALTGATAYAPTFGSQAGHVRIRTTSSNGSLSTILFNAPANNANAVLGFSGTYTGYSRVNTTWTQTLGTKQELANQIETVLDSCGWTTISGSGTTNLLLQSGLTPPGQDLQFRLRVKDNAGTCLTLSIENVSGSIAETNSTTVGHYLIPAAGKTWIFTCNKFQGCIRTNGVSAAREWVFFGMPCLPLFLQGVITECFYIQGNGISDTSTQDGRTFNHGPATNAGNVYATGNQCQVVNGVKLENMGGSNNQCAQSLSPATPLAPGGPNYGGHIWHDGSSFILDSLIGFGITNVNDAARIRGYIWDAVSVTFTVQSAGFPVGTIVTLDSHNFIAITDTTKYVAYNGPPLQFFLATP